MAVMGEPAVEIDADTEDFTETELGMLRMLSEGRCTPAYMAEELGVRQEYVRSRLSDLCRLGCVKRIHRGLYALAD